MFLKILIVPMMMIFSCSPAAKESSLTGTENVSNKNLSLISATESVWNGGVRGVRGKVWTIKIKSKLKSKITFSDVEIDGNKIPVDVIFKNKIYTITARLTTSNGEPNVDEVESPESKTSSSGGILHYNFPNSKTVNKFQITKFVFVENLNENREVPVQ